MFPYFDFEKLEGNLLKIDDLSEEDESSSVKGKSSSVGHLNPKASVPVHMNDVPTLSSWTQKGFQTFLYNIKNHVAKGLPCAIATSITNDKCKSELYWSLHSYELIKGISLKDYLLNLQLDDVLSFITLGEALVKKWALPKGGDLSDQNIVRNELDFDINFSERNNGVVMLNRIARFTSEFHDIYFLSLIHI